MCANESKMNKKICIFKAFSLSLCLTLFISTHKHFIVYFWTYLSLSLVSQLLRSRRAKKNILSKHIGFSHAARRTGTADYGNDNNGNDTKAEKKLCSKKTFNKL